MNIRIFKSFQILDESDRRKKDKCFSSAYKDIIVLSSLRATSLYLKKMF